MSRPGLTIIAGPTASGKTALAIEVARALKAEIVNADSQQIYRGFDIGTAKPSPAELAAVPHHLISTLEPQHRCSAAQYLQLADAAIADIHARGRAVVVVGGTGLYIRVLLHGVVEAPGSNADLRATWEALADREGNAALHAQLAQVDPETAQRLPVADRVRIIRALEIHALTGQTASAHRARHQFAPWRYRATLWVLNPDRETLYARINQRTEAMFAHGLLEETQALIAAGLRDTAPMESVGYAQALACLEGRMTPAEAIADCAQKTRHYAKRQFTWFRKEQGAQLIAPPFDVAHIVSAHPVQDDVRLG